MIFDENILYQLIEGGQTHMGIPRGAKISLAPMNLRKEVALH